MDHNLNEEGSAVSYSICYSTNSNSKYLTKKKQANRTLIIFSIFLVALVVGFVLCVETFRTVISPGDPNVTDAAFLHMIEKLENGDSFYDAAQAFCTEIIGGGIQN